MVSPQPVQTGQSKHKSKQVAPPNNEVMQKHDRAISYISKHENANNLSSTNVSHLVSLCYQYARHELSYSAFEAEVSKHLDNK